MTSRVSRRKFVLTTGVAGVTAVSGCLSGSDTSSDDDGTDDESESTPIENSERPPHSRVASVYEQPHVDWRNTGYIAGTPVTTTPEERWVYEFEQLEGVQSGFTVTKDTAFYVDEDTHNIKGFGVGSGEIEIEVSLGVNESLPLVTYLNRVLAGGTVQTSDFKGFFKLTDTSVSGTEWSQRYRQTPVAAPSIYQSEVYIPLQGGEISVLDVIQSQEKTRVPTTGGTPVVSTPAAVTNSLIVTTQSHVDVYNRDDTSNRWNKQQQTTHASIVTSDSVYTADTTGVTSHALTNGDVQWEYETSDITSMCIDNQFVYTTTTTGNVACLAVESGDEKWTSSIPSTSIQDTVLQDTVLYVAGNKSVRAVDADTGDVLWEYTTDDAITTPVTPIQKAVIFGTASKTVCLEDSSESTDSTN